MHSLKDIQLKCNKQFIVNFEGGELSSDGGVETVKNWERYDILVCEEFRCL